LRIDGTSLIWRGKATQKRLEEYVMQYGKSLELGGANEHISKSLGYIPYPNKAILIRQSTNEVVATWQAAMFQVW